MSGNLYWSTYKQIEKEVLELSYDIAFNDEQLEVYSPKILDLIIRISTNIESLYLDIYRVDFGKDIEIGQAIKDVAKKYKLEEKIIHISHENFSIKNMRNIKPFQYKKKSKDDFYSTYNALKHDRAKNLHKATIYALIRSLAALYALNVIYDDRVIPVQNDIYGTEVPIEYSYNTDIFSANVFNKSLDDMQQALAGLYFEIENNPKLTNPWKDMSEMYRKCEENTGVRFRGQNNNECLFVTSISSNYMKKLRLFEKKYVGNNVATKTELLLLFGDHYDPKTYEQMDLKSLDVLMDQIVINLQRSIISLEVNKSH